MTLWLVNPGKKRKRDKRGRFSKATARKTRKRRATSTTRRKAPSKKRGLRMASRKRDSKGRFLKRGRAATTTRRRKRKRTTVARRRSSAPSRKRARRRYRRNPKMRPLQTLMQGARGAIGVTLGKAAARAIPQQTGLPTTGPTGIAVTAGVAIVIGMLAEKVARRDAPFILAGALSGTIESVIRDAGIPVLSPALAAYPVSAPGYPRVGSGRPAVGTHAGVSSYPTLDNNYMMA